MICWRPSSIALRYLSLQASGLDTSISEIEQSVFVSKHLLLFKVAPLEHKITQNTYMTSPEGRREERLFDVTM